MRQVEIGVLQYHHPQLFKSGVAAAVALFAIMLMLFGWRTRQIALERARQQAAMSAPVALLPLEGLSADGLSITNSLVGSFSFNPEYPLGKFWIQPKKAGAEAKIVTGSATRAPQAEVSLEFVPLGYVISELMEGEALAAEEAQRADPAFGAVYREVVTDRKAIYRDGVRQKHELSEAQMNLIYRIALDGLIYPGKRPGDAR